MAYTFDQINGLMGGGGTGQQKSDIFSGGGQPPQGQQQAGSQGSQPSGNEPEQTDASQKPQAPKPVQGGGATQSAILDKNSFGSQPGFTNEVKSSISKAQGDLQNEANSYMNAQTAKGSAQLQTDDLDKALSGDTAAAAKTQGYLYNNAPKADAYQSGVNTDFGKLDQLNDTGSLQQYLKQKGPETYNQGLASLDAQLLTRDPQYQQGLKEARAQRDALQQLKADYSNNEQSRAQTALDQTTSAGKQQAIDYLKNQGSSWNENNAKEVAAENAARANLRANPDQAFLNQNVQKAYAELAQNSPDLAKYLPQNAMQDDIHTLGADPKSYQSNWANQFYKVNGDVDSAATSQDAMRFNQLQKLLNSGGHMDAANLGSRQDVDYNGLKQKMIEIAQRQKAIADNAQNIDTGNKTMANSFLNSSTS